MTTQAQAHLSIFHTIVLAAVIALLITSAALPMAAQSSVPATASQAAKMPQFASRLAHPAPTHMPAKPKASSPTGNYSPGGGLAYDNGPVNGQVDAWTINFGYAVSNSIQLAANTPVQGVDFWAWLIPGDTITNVQVSIGSSPFQQDLLNATLDLTQSQCFPNELGYNVCLETATITGNPNLSGNAWITLQNANLPSGDPVYWDENSGVGCQSPGCPSQAENNSVGTIPSEAFSIEGMCQFSPAQQPKVVNVPHSPTQTYRVIYNFTGAADGGYPTTGLLVDAAGNLYGTTGSGGSLGQGTVFRLTPGASGWRFDRIYSFSGANGAGPDNTLVRGADGRLFGTTYGGGSGNGVLYGLSPGAHILPTVFSNWLETLLYSFNGNSDGAHPGGSLVLDSSGNIYGTTSAAGANSGGTLYEFTSSGIQVLHAFPAFRGDGSDPNDVVHGSDGLYGITGSGGQYSSGTLFTTAGGYQILHNFQPNVPEGSPVDLTADATGNLYGTDSYMSTVCWDGQREPAGNTQIFSVSPPDWNPTFLYSYQQLFVPMATYLTTDSSGDIFGATDNTNSVGNVFELTCCWNYTDLHDFANGPNDGANPQSSPVVDAHGNIYGTTFYGGTYGVGVVWEITP